MASSGYALYATAIGACGIAWGSRGIVGAQLPEAEEQATRARMRRRFPALEEVEPPSWVQRDIAAIRALLDGEPLDLGEIELDLEGVGDFHRRVYAITRRIPPGSTRTYGDIAEELGDKGLARAVGQALGLNPFAPIVPCHRVLAAGGKWGGFSAHGGAASKLRMLAIEGARPASDTAPLF
jgi:methylated-DNA-[protein]-cysteine S-methyltransferase